MPVNATSGFPTYSITVNDTTPVWAYVRPKNTIILFWSNVLPYLVSSSWSLWSGYGLRIVSNTIKYSELTIDIRLHRNAVDNGPKNFTAFQSAARQLNGTAATGSSSGTAAESTTSGGSRTASVSLGMIVAAVFMLLWTQTDGKFSSIAFNTLLVCLRGVDGHFYDKDNILYLGYLLMMHSMDNYCLLL